MAVEFDWAAAHDTVAQLALSIAAVPGASFASLVAALRLHLQAVQLVQQHRGFVHPGTVARLLTPPLGLARLRYVVGCRMKGLGSSIYCPHYLHTCYEARWPDDLMSNMVTSCLLCQPVPTSPCSCRGSR